MKLNLSGELIPSDWAEIYRRWGYASGFYCPDDVRNAIDNLEPGEELLLEVNSIGGSVFGGNEIYALLEGCPNPTRAVIQSMAASAASYMIMPCNRIEIHLPAQLMIHRASTYAWGNSEDLQQAQQMLDVTDEAILNTYCRRCGDRVSREELAVMMENETYIGAADALRYGLVDSIIGGEDNAQSGLLVASAFNNTVKAMRTLPDIQTLLDAEKNESNRLREELEMEKNKFI
ncbi:MAG: Clp protease ClpP [Oscillospiraceae bacterium]